MQKKQGLTLLSKIEGSSRYLYRFYDCGHSIEHIPSKLKNITLTCDLCLLEKNKNDAKEKGLTLLSKSDVTGTYIYIFDKCGHEKKYKPSALKKVNPICNECHLDKISIEAKEKSMTLLSKSTKTGFYLYQFDNCGHTKEYKPSKLKNIKPICDPCLLQKNKKEAKQKGLTLISKSEKTGYFIYKNDECGHTKEYKPADLRKVNPVCDHRILEKNIEQAKKKGLTLIGKAKAVSRYVYQFDKCGHQKEYIPFDLHRIKPVCEPCALERLKSDAKKKGLTLIGKSKTVNRYVYQFDKCEHQKEYIPSELKKVNPNCDVCGDSHFKNQTKIYLLHIYNEHNSFLKFGIANDIDERIKAYKLDPSYNVEKIHSILLDSKYIALRHEGATHKRLSNIKLNSDIMQSIMKSGYTECYPITAERILLNEMTQTEQEEKLLAA